MTLLAIDNAVRDSMMQLTGQNGFMRSLSGGYKMMNGSRVGKLISKNRRSVVRESTESCNRERIEDGESIVNEFYKKQCHV